MKKTLSTVAAFVLILGGIGVRAAIKYHNEHESAETTINCHGVSFTIPGDWRPDDAGKPDRCKYQSGHSQALIVVRLEVPHVLTPEEAKEAATQKDQDYATAARAIATRNGENLQIDPPIPYEWGSLQTVQRTVTYADTGHLVAIYTMISPTDATTLVLEAEKMNPGSFKQMYLRIFEAARKANSASVLAPSQRDGGEE